MLPGGFTGAKELKAAAARPVLSFPGHVPLAVPDPRVPGVPRTCSQRTGRGESPGFPARSRRSAEAPDQWLWASRGSCLGQHRRQPALALAARPSPTERARARNVLGTFCPQLLGKPCGQSLCTSPAAVPCSLPARCRRGLGRQRPGPARRQGAGGRVDALAERTAPGAAPAAQRIRARALC